MSRRIYNLVVAGDAELTDETQSSANTADLAVLGNQASVEKLSQGPGDLRLRGQFRDATYARKLAAELRELATAPDVKTVPIFKTGDPTNGDGYYVLERVRSIGPVKPQSDRVQEFDLSVSRNGGRNRQWRGVATNKTDITTKNDFSNGGSARISIPASSSKRRWYDPEAGETVAVGSPDATVTANNGDLVQFLVSSGESALSASDVQPTLIYDVPYADQGRVDPQLWDDRGNAGKVDSNYGASGVDAVQWQRVFDPSHEFRGEPVFSNGRLRIFVDEANKSIAAERWDDSNDTWSSVYLQGSSWDLLDVDVVQLGTGEHEAHIIFQNFYSDNLYALRLILQRGAADAIWLRPPNESTATPGGLQNLLDPIASDVDNDAQPSDRLVARKETRE